jgi:hypothetical protein
MADEPDLVDQMCSIVYEAQRLDPTRSLLDLIAIQQDLGDLLGCEFDVVSDKSLSPYICSNYDFKQKASPSPAWCVVWKRKRPSLRGRWLPTQRQRGYRDRTLR